MPRALATNLTGLYRRFEAPRPRLPQLPPRFRSAVRVAVLIPAVYLALKALAWIVPLPAAASGAPHPLWSLIAKASYSRLSSRATTCGASGPVLEISPYLQSACWLRGSLVLWHPGLNPVALGRAVVQNLARGARGFRRLHHHDADRPDDGAKSGERSGARSGRHCARSSSNCVTASGSYWRSTSISPHTAAISKAWPPRPGCISARNRPN